MAYILIHNVNGTYRHHLLMNVPFTAKEIEAVYRNGRKTFDKVEQIPFTPAEIPPDVTAVWLEQRGIDYYNQILRTI